ncbi:MAG: hypothetical protein CM1200mP10_02010 [Candidatus Neomarinimicrobiota bacterium]|nr:MAG: hypothetical protein CM1200mP10_02010 [Candidatus Neomarinimicrobiota bacterium]
MLLRFLLEDVSISLNIAQLLEKTIFAPQGITIQGEINEQFFGDIDNAMKFYNNLLESYPCPCGRTSENANATVENH